MLYETNTLNANIECDKNYVPKRAYVYQSCILSKSIDWGSGHKHLLLFTATHTCHYARIIHNWLKLTLHIICIIEIHNNKKKHTHTIQTHMNIEHRFFCCFPYCYLCILFGHIKCDLWLRIFLYEKYGLSCIYHLPLLFWCFAPRLVSRIGAIAS